MKKTTRFLHILLHPPAITAILAAAATAAMLIYMLTDASPDRRVFPAFCILAAYMLAAACARIPQAYRYWQKMKRTNRFLSVYFGDVRFRTRLTLFISHIWNAAYAALQLLTGFHYHSFWFYSLAAYHALLAIIRWSILKDIRNTGNDSDIKIELRRYRICGVTLLLINQALAVIVIMIVYLNRGFDRNYIFTVCMAVYTFIAIILAVKNLIVYRRYASPLLSAAKILSFTSALVSLLSLETALFSIIPAANAPSLRRLITGITGAAVCAITLFMAIRMIIRSTRRLKKLRSKI